MKRSHQHSCVSLGLECGGAAWGAGTSRLHSCPTCWLGGAGAGNGHGCPSPGAVSLGLCGVGVCLGLIPRSTLVPLGFCRTPGAIKRLSLVCAWGCPWVSDSLRPEATGICCGHSKVGQVAGWGYHGITGPAPSTAALGMVEPVSLQGEAAE